nr:hypothetical protein [Mesorhizobium alhagi]
MTIQLAQYGAHAVPLEPVKHMPDRSIGKCYGTKAFFLNRLIIQKLLEQMEQRLLVDELGTTMPIHLLQVSKNLVLHVDGQSFISPDFVKPGQQILAIAVSVHHEIQFDVRPLDQPQPFERKIRAPDHSVFPRAIVDMYHFSMKKTGATNRTNVDF